MKKFLDWVLKRARVPSTWIGLTMIAVVLGVDPMQAQRVGHAVSMIVAEGLGNGAEKDVAEPAGEPEGEAVSAEEMEGLAQ